jgi:hypothetical protein
VKRLTSIGVTDERIIHPPMIQTKLVDLRREAERKVLEENDNFRHVNCPACYSNRDDNAFIKRNFTFRECNDCRTIFMSPRPNLEQLKWYYNSSKYSEYMKSDEYRNAICAYQSDVASKRADRLAVLNQKVPESKDRIILYAERSNVLSSTLKHLGFSEVYSKHSPWEDVFHKSITKDTDIISAFDIVERLSDPIAELKALYSMLRDTGMLMCTMRSCSGFDFLSLWQHSDIQPIEHMNLLSVEGATSMLKMIGFKIQEVSTPGSLDIQFVKRIRAENNLKINRFVDYLLDFRDEFAINEFQQYLQRGLLSSHLVVVGQKA